MSRLLRLFPEELKRNSNERGCVKYSSFSDVLSTRFPSLGKRQRKENYPPNTPNSRNSPTETTVKLLAGRNKKTRTNNVKPIGRRLICPVIIISVESQIKKRQNHLDTDKDDKYLNYLGQDTRWMEIFLIKKNDLFFC